MVKTYKNWILEEEAGQGMVEYALILALIALFAVGVMSTIGTKLVDLYNYSAQKIKG